MDEDRKPFGIVEDSMKSEVESYMDDLLSRAVDYLQNEAIPAGMLKGLDADNVPSTPENTYASCIEKRNLPAALVWKSIIIETLRAEANGQKFEDANGAAIKRRLIILIQMIKDDVDDMIAGTDFGFLESMSIEELKHELSKAYEEDEIPVIVFFVSAYLLKQKLSRISGVD